MIRESLPRDHLVEHVFAVLDDIPQKAANRAFGRAERGTIVSTLQAIVVTAVQPSANYQADPGADEHGQPNVSDNRSYQQPESCADRDPHLTLYRHGYGGAPARSRALDAGCAFWRTACDGELEPHT